jgi:hypothetical protein
MALGSQMHHRGGREFGEQDVEAGSLADIRANKAVVPLILDIGK